MQTADDARADLIRVALAATVPWSAFSGKWFISDVYATLVAQGRCDDVSLDEFKGYLRSMLTSGHVLLARADLVQSMPFDKVQASEITDGHASWHFIVHL